MNPTIDSNGAPVYKAEYVALLVVSKIQSCRAPEYFIARDVATNVDIDDDSKSLFSLDTLSMSGVPRSVMDIVPPLIDLSSDEEDYDIEPPLLDDCSDKEDLPDLESEADVVWRNWLSGEGVSYMSSEEFDYRLEQMLRMQVKEEIQCRGSPHHHMVINISQIAQYCNK